MTSTKRLILDYFAENQTATAPELSRILHLTPANMRYHLANLRDQGEITVVDSLNVARKGRPSKIYRLARPPDPSTYLILVKSLLNAFNGDMSKFPLKAVAKTLSKLPDGETKQHTVQILNNTIESLNNYGHQANWIASKGGPTIELHGCPFHQIITDHPELCELDREVINCCTRMEFEQTEKLKTDKKKRAVCNFRLKGS